MSLVKIVSDQKTDWHDITEILLNMVLNNPLLHAYSIKNITTGSVDRNKDGYDLVLLFNTATHLWLSQSM